MTEVSFYILNQAALAERINYACRLIEKAHKNRMSVIVHCESQDQAQVMDETLWSLKPERFIPHALLSEDIPSCPVIISHGDEVPPPKDILINLSQKTPTFFSQFNRHFEILCQSADILAAGREKWRFFQDRGYPMKKFDIAS